MPKTINTHPYSAIAAHQRLMLLIAAIANNPGIAPSGVGVDSIQVILEAMKAIATDLGLEWHDWKAPTIRKDLELLRQYRLLPPHSKNGYYLTGSGTEIKPVIRQRASTKSKLSPSTMLEMTESGMTLEQIGAIAGISKQQVSKAIGKEKKTGKTIHYEGQIK